MSDYDHLHRTVLLEHKFNFMVALMYYKSFLSTPDIILLLVLCNNKSFFKMNIQPIIQVHSLRFQTFQTCPFVHFETFLHLSDLSLLLLLMELICFIVTDRVTLSINLFSMSYSFHDIHILILNTIVLIINAGSINMIINLFVSPGL